MLKICPRLKGVITPVLGVLVCSLSAYASNKPMEGADGAADALFAARCAVCHESQQNNTPSRAAISYRGPDSVVRTLTDGLMQPMAVGLSAEQIQSLAVLLTGREPLGPVDHMANACPKDASPVHVSANDWSSVSGDLRNSRYRDHSSVTAEDIGRLQVKWAFAYPGGASGMAAMAGGRLFLATGTGFIMSLDADSGCTHWAYDNKGALTRRVSVAAIKPGSERAGVFFGDANGRVAALDAQTGELLWRTEVEVHVLSRISSSPSIHDGRVYVPVSSIEDPLTHDPSHQCCTSRGSVVALDASSGKVLWKQYNIAQAPQAQPVDDDPHTPAFSPAGASIYVPLAIDTRRGVLYASTAEAYTYENPAGSYSVIAYDLLTGERKWEQQFLPAGKEREAACEAVGYTDCRNLFSMGTAVTIHTLMDGREILLVGQKSGYVYALDPDKQGQVLWRNKVAHGGDLGGIMYGVAVDKDAVYVPISDAYFQLPVTPDGLARLDAATGETRWKIARPEARCSWGEEGCEASAVSPATLMPGAVFVGFADGHLRVYRPEDGELMRDMDLAKPYEAVNGVPAHGGPVNGYPVVIGEGGIYVVSGGSTQTRPGNVLLKFTVDGK
ncbi:MAG: PQQ-binding-like beta-propeller repeat protein [Halieaceae bacterium]|jgi:polyvinyl alcohol dehydrogenase (cytochrome)|nr:PQQ-binding-like beta-propeller repeat protein [Halieaceae bacterium]